MNQQMDKIGGIPTDVYKEIAQMDDDSISILLQSHPEILEDF